MENKIFYSDDYIVLTAKGQEVYLKVKEEGYSMEMLNSVLANHHEIELESFILLKNAFKSALNSEAKIGKLKERIILDINLDLMKAYVKFNLSTKELSTENRKELAEETLKKLHNNGIVFGIKENFLSEELVQGKSYLCAEGLRPVRGEDSIIKTLNVENGKPILKQEGKIDYYDLMLIKKVDEGDWLGERIDPTEGIPGKNIKGEIISQEKGKLLNLNYDKTSVSEVKKGNITTLIAMHGGAVKNVDGRITIQRHLEISGDVDFKTGNIKFNGYVTIRGTVIDGFSVEASNDIEIEGALGIGNVKSIISTHGSIYIKGGISSKSRCVVKAKENIYIKFAENTEISCGEILHVGYYCIHCNVNAREVIVEASNGHIIGGNTIANIKISVPILGSESYKRTTVVVKGFDRNLIAEELEKINSDINKMKDETQRAKQLVAQLTGKGQLNPDLHKNVEEMIHKLTFIKEEMKLLETKKKSYSEYLKAKGDGEINVLKKIYPNCQITMSTNTFEISRELNALTYYIQNGELKTIF